MHIQLFRDAEKPAQAYGAFSLVGLLCSYGKFEFTNPYRTRLDHFTDIAAIARIADCVGYHLSSCRDAYASLQEDHQESWLSASSTLNMLSLGLLAPTSQLPAGSASGEDLKRALAEL